MASKRSPIHYLVGTQALTHPSKMGNAILNRNRTTWANTDTRLALQAFYEPTMGHRIFIRDQWAGWAVMVGGGGYVLMGRLGNMEELKREKGIGRAHCGVVIGYPWASLGQKLGGKSKNAMPFNR